MIQVKQKQKCCGCQACTQACPQNCIAMMSDEEGFLYPVVRKEDCIQCGLCEKVCPVMCKAEETHASPKAYAAYCLDEDIRMMSSSGGIFTILAEQILLQNGVVYGAAMEGGSVRHIRVAMASELGALRGSKYVQSDIGNSYIDVQQDLNMQKPVLFTGTPCQIEGLKRFLRREYENLLCMDIICHGVPSPMVWERYVALREKVAGNPVESISFRHKTFGWKEYSILFKFSDKSIYICKHQDDPFMKAFLRDYCLRPSCYECSFKKENRMSDITVADFWGIESVCPEMDDDKGTSLVILHSSKGMEMFQRLTPRLCYQIVDFNTSLKGNPAMIKSPTRPRKRDAFMRQIQTGQFEATVLRYAKQKTTAKETARKMLKTLGLYNIARVVKHKFLR